MRVSSGVRKWAGGLSLACAATWLLPAIVAIVYGVWALTSVGARSPGVTTGPGPIVDGVIAAIAVVAVALGTSMIVPGLFLLGSGVAQIRRGIGHSATVSVVLALAAMLGLAAVLGTDQVMSTGGMAVGLPVLALHLAALGAAFWHAESRGDVR